MTCRIPCWVTEYGEQYENETRGLDYEAKGFRGDLIDLLRRCGGCVRDDLPLLKKLLGQDIRVVTRLWGEVKHLFTVVGGWIRHHRVDEAIERLEKTGLPPNFRQKCRPNPLKTNKPADNNYNIPLSQERRKGDRGSGANAPPDAVAPSPADERFAPAAAPANTPPFFRTRA